MAVLSLKLDRDQKQVSVYCDGANSHTFTLANIALSKKQAEQFISDPSIYGQQLYAALFPAKSCAADALAPGQEFYLHLESEVLNDIPWEYAFDGRHWIAVEYGLARTATVQVQSGINNTVNPERLRFLFIPSDPLLHNGHPAPYHLGLEDEWEDLVRDLSAMDPAVDLIRVTPPTYEQLQESVAGMEAGVVHFTGHGAVQDGKAWLMFEQPCGVSKPVESERFSSVLGRRAALVLLSACQSAVPGKSEEANLAALLAARGIPFVIGMQLSVPDLQARRFTDTFYHFLFSGEHVFEAVRQARLRILEESPLVMGIPVLYVSAPSLNGNLRPKGKGLAIQQPGKALLEGLPTVDTGFWGRQEELADIGIHLTAERKRDGDIFEACSVTLHGIGGIGKTALLVKASQRFAWAFPDGVIAIPLEPMPATLEEVMVRMEKSLSLPEGSALSTADRQARLLGVMQGRKILLALDNFETIFKARDEGTAEQKETALLLYDFFTQIPARGPILLLSSREITDLPGERIIDVTGLSHRAGAQLFKTLVSSRKSELTEEECLEISGKVDGHPLALKLLAPLFDRGEGTTLADFVAHLEENLGKASKKMAAGRRQDTLQLCFDFSLAHLEKTKPELVDALARLTVFHSEFIDMLAAPVIFGKANGQDERAEEQNTNQSARYLHALWEYGQIEREVVTVGEEVLLFFRLHPTLRPFAAMHLKEAGRLLAENDYIYSLNRLGGICYPGHAQGGIYAHRALAVIAYKSLPDFRRAGLLKRNAENAILCFRGGFLLRHFGDLAGAMGLYQQSLEIIEGLGDLQGKSATLHAMAYILRVRGDLAGAMGLYQQSLEIKEGLGDLKGKSATLHEMAYILRVRGDLAGAMGLYQQSLEIDEGLGDLQGMAMTLGMMGQNLWASNKPAEAIRALLRGFLILTAQQMEPETQKAMAENLRDMRQQSGAELFDPIWQELTEGAPIPEWLTKE